MKTIFETFKKSIYNPSFYKEATNDSFPKILKYYTKMVLLLSLFLVAVLGIFVVPQGIKFVTERAPSLVQEYYPQELTVNIDKGVASANVAMPYFVPLKDLSIATTTDAVRNMLVIDTTQEFDKQKFVEYNTYALLTKTDIVTRGQNNSITIQPVGRAFTATISQDTLVSWVTNIQNYLGTIVVAGLAISFIAVFLGYLMYLLPLTLFALVPKLIAYIKRSPLSYASAYKMSLYAIVPALALKTFLNALGVLFLPSYFTFLVFLLIVSINMREVEEPTLFEGNN
ncbi:MAG: DUF1189 family protein [Candidatus Paceibacterota bacterium]|jgi:hypothetical protein